MKRCRVKHREQVEWLVVQADRGERSLVPMIIHKIRKSPDVQ